jgi:hypothetical protein
VKAFDHGRGVIAEQSQRPIGIADRNCVGDFVSFAVSNDDKRMATREELAPELFGSDVSDKNRDDENRRESAKHRHAPIFL